MEIDVDQFFGSLPSIVLTVRADDQVEFVNRSWEEYTGFHLTSRQTWNWLDAVHPADLGALTVHLQSVRAAETTEPIEVRLRNNVGDFRHFVVQWTPLRSVSGTIEKWCGIATDIEFVVREREQPRAALDFQLVVDSIPLPVAVTTPTGEVEGLNQLTLSYFGLSLSELKQWKASEVVHPDDLKETVEAQLAAHMAGNSYNVESRHLRADGVYRWHNVLGLPLRDAAGNIQRWLHLLIDIHDRKRTEVALADSEREARLIVGTIAGMVALFTPDGKLNGGNQRLLDYFQQPLEEVANWTTNGMTHPEDLQHCVETFTSSLQTGDPYEFETRFRRHDGVYRWFQIRGHPVRGSDGEIARWYGLLTDIDDQRGAVAALRASQAELQLIVNSIPGLIIVLRPDGSVESVNDQSLRYFGYDFHEHQKWQTNNIIHPEDRDRGVARFAEAAASGQSYEIVERLRRNDGAYRWFQLRGSPLLNHDGVAVRWYFLLNDIEDRKQAEVALANSEREFRHIVNMVPGMIILAQPDGTLDGSNQQLLDYFGTSLEEVQDWSTNGITHPDDVQINVDKFMGSLKSGEPYDYQSRYRRHDGVFRWFQVRGQPLRDAEDNIVRWYGLLTDIDDRKKAEDELRRSQALLVAGQRLISTGTFSWHINTDELVLSDEWLRILEFEKDDVVTFEQIGERIHPDDAALFAEKIGAVRDGDGESEYEVRVVGRKGNIKHVRVIGEVIHHQNGQRECLGAIQDVTQRRLTEEARDQLRTELARLTGILSLGQMSAAIAHEVNQPLSGIITNASTCLRMLSADPPDIETALETARRTIRDGNRAAEVITRLRALFSKRIIAFEDIDINDAVSEVVALSEGDQRRNGVSVRTSFTHALPPINGDRVQLQQVIINLLRNAIDAVSGVKDRLRFVEIRTSIDDGGQVSVAVSDNGVGFDLDEGSRIFEAFYTTKNDGMGIGLSVCRSIIESHGGRMWARPNDGPGVTMSFSVPRASTEERGFAAATA
ncbi:PAS domain S-box-containing protein [Pararhizobium capsulatum DSM 1112]|uniref:histidine kinase n=1 Tax=Pararhizobium capsulatum DSM 1112 TaxID=1121113 RepID=A0ABU0C0F3_9HYPH|nr:PAS domain-containing protein [Pararhizobium capsulatum]MDQ0324000.1 PAS domain S-box-containing protein [Pararhizobium capsulatum DSM 1112]